MQNPALFININKAEQSDFITNFYSKLKPRYSFFLVLLYCIFGDAKDVELYN